MLHAGCLHLNVSCENMGDISEEHSEICHQCIWTIERRYQGKWDYYLWGLVHDDSSYHL